MSFNFIPVIKLDVIANSEFEITFLSNNSKCIWVKSIDYNGTIGLIIMYFTWTHLLLHDEQWPILFLNEVWLLTAWMVFLSPGTMSTSALISLHRGVGCFINSHPCHLPHRIPQPSASARHLFTKQWREGKTVWIDVKIRSILNWVVQYFQVSATSKFASLFTARSALRHLIGSHPSLTLISLIFFLLNCSSLAILLLSLGCLLSIAPVLGKPAEEEADDNDGEEEEGDEGAEEEEEEEGE